MLIGLHGKPGVGKDYVAAKLNYYSDVPFFRLAFADKMKESMAALFGISVEQIEESKRRGDWAVKVREDSATWRCFSMREAIQRYGTEAHRDIFGQQFWVDQTLPKGLVHKDRMVVVTDVRFVNEAARVHDLGGKVIEVRGDSDKDSNHRSDIRLPDEVLDGYINNYKTPDKGECVDMQFNLQLMELMA